MILSRLASEDEPRGLELGVTYRGTRGRIYLAIAADRVVTVEHGHAVESAAPRRLEPCRNLAVEELAARWRITLERLDALVSRIYFAPGPASRLAPRGSSSRLSRADRSYFAERRVSLRPPAR